MELRRIVPVAALLLAAACAGNSPKSQLLKAVVARAFGASAVADAGGGAGQPLPGADALYAPIHEKGVAAVRIEAPDTGLADVLIAIALEDDRLTYLGRSNRTVVMRGGLLVATHGFGYDPAPIETDGDDPIARPRPTAAWPDSYARIYRTWGMGPEGQRFDVTCTAKAGDMGTIDFVTPPVVVQRMSETCRGSGIRFTNTYEVEPETGAIWRSSQWTGPQQGLVKVDIIEPFEP